MLLSILRLKTNNIMLDLQNDKSRFQILIAGSLLILDMLEIYK